MSLGHADRTGGKIQQDGVCCLRKCTVEFGRLIDEEGEMLFKIGGVVDGVARQLDEIGAAGPAAPSTARAACAGAALAWAEASAARVSGSRGAALSRARAEAALAAGSLRRCAGPSCRSRTAPATISSAAAGKTGGR